MIIDNIINTLNQIEVRGKDNLSMLLGVIHALEELKKGEEDGKQTDK